jgi:hypothetical protein
MIGSRTSQLLWAAAIGVPIALSAATIGPAWADDGQTPAGASAVQQAPAPGTLPAQPSPANKPGFLRQLEVWWNDSFGDFNAKMKSAKDKLDDYNKQQNQAAKETSAATDCQTTATNACRTKGFDSGQPLDISTSQECPARVMLSGRPPVEGECKDVTFILRAVCR